MAEVPRATISAVQKRQEQLRRWHDSETNREPEDLKRKQSRIKFHDGCVFLAACSAGDTQEVDKLLARGADINTTNVDGLTALHQACIDENMTIVEYLVENSASVNSIDNEGWTPLHAAASCGYTKIAEYLLEKGANIAAVNNDGELPYDIADGDELENILLGAMNKLGIDMETARNEEENRMLADANQWLKGGIIREKKHPKTGATALHVASSKGYIKVVNVLLEAGANAEEADNDGWTALHGAAHWGQREACEVLALHGCNIDTKNLVGQSASDVADDEMVKWLDELRKKQLEKKKPTPSILPRKIPPPLKRRSSVPRMSVQDKSSNVQKDMKGEGAAQVQLQLAPHLKKMDSEEDEDEESEAEKSSQDKKPSKVMGSSQMPLATVTIETGKPAVASSSSSSSSGDDEESESSSGDSASEESESGSEAGKVAIVVSDGYANHEPPQRKEVKPEEPALRRKAKFQELPEETQEEKHRRLSRPVSAPAPDTTPVTQVPTTENRYSYPVSQRLANRKLSQPYSVLTRKVMARGSITVPASIATTTSVATTTSISTTTSVMTPNVTTAAAPSMAVAVATSPPPSATLLHLRQRLNEITESTAVTMTTATERRHTRRSVVPPTPDEESETKRKARSRLARQTRRSTQGVTGEEIAEAQQQMEQWKKDRERKQQEEQKQTENKTPEKSRIPSLLDKSAQDKPKLAVPEGNGPPLSPGGRRRLMGQVGTSTPAATQSVSQPVRKPVGKTDDKENEQKPDKKQQEMEEMERRREANLRRKQKVRQRRGTGTIIADEDEEEEEEPTKVLNSKPEDSKNLSDRSRAQPASISERFMITRKPCSQEDFKKLYEDTQSENRQLKDKLKTRERDLEEIKKKLDQALALKNGSIGQLAAEANRKERRALEMKISELEEQVKEMDAFRSDNQRLKEENAALIRVISKLSK
ncbi:PREDICTED: protein phosphatase 1 regulatory subunit 12A-like [Priapulus caudatus]|uniref:Protein phosphatase 1 regulatory subunit 12A-like n=1 Tax=Priapulus caudatus TaxID=37621 RepID=A0ABM1EFJ3_PRICU|nr:PREDICTED: protein phosphatase 1 regulatory subunit 12A-like [Priapulus caudatus]